MTFKALIVDKERRGRHQPIDSGDRRGPASRSWGCHHRRRVFHAELQGWTLSELAAGGFGTQLSARAGYRFGRNRRGLRPMSRYRPGDKVVLTGWRVGEVWWGGYAQIARVKADWQVPLPGGLSTKQAMAVGTAGFTAMLAVMALGRSRVGTGPGRGSGDRRPQAAWVRWRQQSWRTVATRSRA